VIRFDDGDSGLVEGFPKLQDQFNILHLCFRAEDSEDLRSETDDRAAPIF
jgi:hypothetical protein